MVILSLKLVLRAGLEPTTLCLEGRCSIQLSYRSISAVRTSKNVCADLHMLSSLESSMLSQSEDKMPHHISGISPTDTIYEL